MKLLKGISGMDWRKNLALCLPFCIVAVSAATGQKSQLTQVTRVRAEPDGRFLIDNAPTFPIGFTSGPPTGAAAADGTNAMAKLKQEGFTFQQWICPKKAWGPQKEAELDALLLEADQQGMHVAVSIADLQQIADSDTAHLAELKRVVSKYRDNPALLFWKGVDEPQWNKVPPENLRVYHDTIRALDPNHPVWVTQAPRGTVADLKPYSEFFDVGAIDIYPVSYPPGTHSGIDNKNLSVVGDYTLRIRQAIDHQKPAMMTLQICWSGVTKPGTTLRFPTFPEERYMSYQAIIDGAHALLYFGGGISSSLNQRDAAYGWNWTFFERVLRPVLDELRPDGPLYPALVAPKSKLPIESDGGPELEFAAREAGSYLYILAARREGSTSQVSFTGLPRATNDGEVLFEAPRQVQVVDGKFTDWFGPNEVHVYRFHRS
jgi:hypothetical protein